MGVSPAWGDEDRPVFDRNLFVDTKISTESFVRRFMDSQDDLYAYMLSLVPSASDAQDVLQETAVALWSKKDEYNAEEPFIPWAIRFAYFQVLSFRKRQRHRSGTVLFSDEVISALADEHSRHRTVIDLRREALAQCIEKVPTPGRQLLRQRYQEESTIKEIAVRVGKKADTLYKQLERLRQQLLDCITRTLAAQRDLQE